MCDCSSLNSPFIPSNLSSTRLRCHSPSSWYKARCSWGFARGGGSEVVRWEPGGWGARLPVEGSQVARKHVIVSDYPDPLRAGRFVVKRGGRDSTCVACNSSDYPPESYDSLKEVVFSQKDGDGDTSDASAPSKFDILELRRELEKEESEGRVPYGLDDENNLIPSEEFRRVASDSGEENRVDPMSGSRRGRRTLRRSSLLAKPVISVQTARSLGFISDLWVDTTLWIVVVVEVRPNLLSGEIEKLLLEDVRQVGDVVLVQDESVMENELRMVGLDTLVGYNVVTSGRRNIGKVRGYNFNINSGAVESLELDSFGMSIIPSSLVSTYSLMVEDVIEVVSDIVVVHESAASRLQRLTKGFWGTRTSEAAWDDDVEELSEFRRRSSRRARRRSSGQSFSSRKFSPKVREAQDGWDLPMDF